MRVKTRNSVSKLLEIWTFLLLLILKGAFPKPAYAFLSSLDSCAAQPACASAISSEVAPAVAAPTGAGFGASTLSTTTATGNTSTFVKAVADAVILATAAEATQGDASWHYWGQGINTQAQVLAKQRYCAVYPNDSVCTPFKGGQGSVNYYFGYSRRGGAKDLLSSCMDYAAAIALRGPIRSITPVRTWSRYWYGTYGWVYQICNDSECIVGYTKDYSDDSYPAPVLTVIPNGALPDTGNPPPLPWKDWPQEKRSIAVAALKDSDWQGLISSMPEGGRLNPGDKVNAPTIVIPGQQTDDPNTPVDERLLRKDPGFFRWSGLPTTDFDLDGTPDSADPEPQNPNVPVASSNPPADDTPSQGEQAVDQVREDYDDFLEKPENATYKDRLSRIKEKYRQAAELEDEAAVDINAGFEQVRLVAEADRELEQLKNELGEAWWSSLSKDERQLFGSRHSPDIDEVQRLKEDWSPATFEQEVQTYEEGIARNVLHHADDKGYENPLEYMRDADRFNKSKDSDRAVRRTPPDPTQFREDDTAVWRNSNNREFIIVDKEGKIRTYGFDPY